MSATPLYKQAFATASAGGQAVFTFDVPQQGSVWTGTIAAVVPNIPGYNFTALLNVRQQALFGSAIWTMFRNGIPELTWLGFTVLTDFQAYGLEQITIQANGLVPNTNYQLAWTGHNQSVNEAPILYPSFSTTTTLSTGPVASQIQAGQTGNIQPGNTVVLIPVIAGTQWQIWDLTLDVTGTGDGSGDAVFIQSVTAQLHTAGTVIARCDLAFNNWAARAVSPVAKVLSQQMRGFQLPVGDGLDIVVPALGAGSVFRAVGSATFNTI